jgi:hypothetical protein
MLTALLLAGTSGAFARGSPGGAGSDVVAGNGTGTAAIDGTGL